MRSSGFTTTAFGLLSLVAPSIAYWRMPCPGRIVTERIDPIVSPGAVSGHVHTVSGGNGFDFSMDYASTQSSTCSSCPIKQDLSNYWTPKLYYQSAEGTFIDVPQAGDGEGVYGGMTVYYLQRGGPNNDNLTAFPEGFRMLAGDPFKRAYTDDFPGQAVSFVCLNYNGVSGYTSGLPNTTCPDGLRAQVFFPSCWDGVNLDSADHKSHMAYPTEYSYDNGPCPASHPVHMISIFYEIIYSTAGFDWWNGTQQPFVFADGDPTGYGFHGDFLNGWDVAALQNATDNCNSATGIPADCNVFDFFTTEESQACIIAPKVDEPVTGNLSALPGCNPVTWGPGEAPTHYASCPTTEIGTAAVYYTNVTGWEYMGCGADSTSNRTMTGSSYFSSSMTLESCMSYCKNKGYHYAGLEYSTQCYCDNSISADAAPVPGVLGNCFSPCAGNSSEYCGGSNRLSIYYTDTVSNTVSCPTGNNTYYTNPNGTSFLVQCGFDSSGSDMGMVYSTNGIQGCIDACGAQSGCKSVAMSGQACYMKSTLGSPVKNSGVQAARLVASIPSSSSSTTSASATSSSSSSLSSSSSKTSSTSSTISSSSKSSSTSSSISSSSSSSSTSTSSSATSKSSTISSSSSKSSSTLTSSSTLSSSSTSTSTVYPTSTAAVCPASNNTMYIDAATGSKFIIECGIDHSAGDMGMVYVKDLAGCVSACATTTGCVDVSLSGTACYMKKTLGSAVGNSGVKGARLVISSTTSSVGTVSTAAAVNKLATSSSSSKATSTTVSAKRAIIATTKKMTTVTKKTTTTSHKATTTKKA